MNELTPLQMAFIKSKVARRVFREVLTLNTGRSFRGNWTDYLLATIAQDMSDERIADILFFALHCDDITDADRQEIQQILYL